MKILFIGDTFGKSGRAIVTSQLSPLRKKYSPDIVIMNAENLAGGQSTTEKTLIEMENAGVDFFTGGNHSFKNLEVYNDTRTNLIRPANMEKETPGKGYDILWIKGKKLAIINLLGRGFMRIPVTCPFRSMQNILQNIPSEVENIFVDFHAETTSEKAAFYHLFKNDIAACIGTHTHVPTADARIDANGCFFQTDVGMTGPVESVIGIDVESAIETFLSPFGKKKFTPKTTGDRVFRAVLLDITGNKTHTYDIIEIFESA